MAKSVTEVERKFLENVVEKAEEYADKDRDPGFGGVSFGYDKLAQAAEYILDEERRAKVVQDRDAPVDTTTEKDKAKHKGRSLTA